MKKRRHAAQRIDVRPGQGLGEWIQGFAEEWRLSRSEALRRIAILAAREFPLYAYPTLHQITEAAEEKYGPRHESFWIVCSSARRRIDQAAEEHGLDTLNPGDVIRVLERTLQALRDAPVLERTPV